MMSLKETLSRLKELSNEKMVALHKKNGARDNLFGVKMGDIRTVAKKIKINHQLALELWDTGNIDARLLATLIVKPESLSANELDNMVKSIDLPQLADWFNSYVLKEHPEREKCREKWMDSAHKWAARSGWSLTAGRISRAPEGLHLAAILSRIETEMPGAAPEVQWTMNTALAQIGIHFPAYRKRAIAIGEQLGVFKDYPVSKGCTSPFAPIWINEIVGRMEKG